MTRYRITDDTSGISSLRQAPGHTSINRDLHPHSLFDSNVTHGFQGSQHHPSSLLPLRFESKALYMNEGPLDP